MAMRAETQIHLTRIHPKVAGALDRSSLPFEVHRHADYAPIASPRDFAAAIGYDLKRITKSLFVRCAPAGFYAMVVCSVASKIDFHAVGEQLHCRKAEMASGEELQAKVGYPPRGVSPIGLDDIPVFIDEGLFQFPTILIGAGQEGVEIEIAPADLAEVTGGMRVFLTR